MYYYFVKKKSSERLRSPTEAGLRSFKEAVQVRKDENVEALDVVGHGKCFQSYTSKKNHRISHQPG